MACGATLKRTYEFDLLHSPSQGTPSKRRCVPLAVAQSAPPTRYHQATPSPFPVLSKLTKEEIASRIGSELKRMHKRRRLFYPPSHSPPLTTCSTLGRQSPSHSSETLTTPSATSDFPFLSSHSTLEASSPKQKDVPLFTFKQVAMICERMIHEKEDTLKETYENALSSKLSEQYEAFLRFNHDQLHRHFGNTPMSYLS